jgi:hypothetical protein
MSRSYPAILEGDRVRWTGAAPADHGPVRVNITVVGPESEGTPQASPAPNGHAQRGRSMADALSRLATSNAFAELTDPSAWQRDTRADRALTGREGQRPSTGPHAP